MPTLNKTESLEVEPGVDVFKCSSSDYNVKPRLRTTALKQSVYDCVYVFFEGIRNKIFVL